MECRVPDSELGQLIIALGEANIIGGIPETWLLAASSSATHGYKRRRYLPGIDVLPGTSHASNADHQGQNLNGTHVV